MTEVAGEGLSPLKTCCCNELAGNGRREAGLINWEPQGLIPLRMNYDPKILMGNSKFRAVSRIWPSHGVQLELEGRG